MPGGVKPVQPLPRLEQPGLRVGCAVDADGRQVGFPMVFGGPFGKQGGLLAAFGGQVFTLPGRPRVERQPDRQPGRQEEAQHADRQTADKPDATVRLPSFGVPDATGDQRIESWGHTDPVCVTGGGYHDVT